MEKLARGVFRVPILVESKTCCFCGPPCPAAGRPEIRTARLSPSLYAAPAGGGMALAAHADAMLA